MQTSGEKTRVNRNMGEPSTAIQEKRSIFIIQNDKAANDPILKEAVGNLRGNGQKFEIRKITKGGEGETLAQEAVRAGFDVVVAAGGDGTLNEVVNGAMKPPGPPQGVAVLPYGTANDFATACGQVQMTIPQQLEMFLTVPTRKIDLGKVNGRLFVNAATGGLGAEVTTETPVWMKRYFGGLAYSLTGLVNWFGKARRRVRIRGLKKSWRGSVFVFAVCNSRLAGGGFQAAPGARLDDGLFDVVILPEINLVEIPATLRDIVSQDKTNLLQMKYFTTPWLDVRSFRDIQVNVDGQPLKDHSFHFEILPRVLPFLLPPEK